MNLGGTPGGNEFPQAQVSVNGKKVKVVDVEPLANQEGKVYKVAIRGGAKKLSRSMSPLSMTTTFKAKTVSQTSIEIFTSTISN